MMIQVYSSTTDYVADQLLDFDQKLPDQFLILPLSTHKSLSKTNLGVSYDIRNTMWSVTDTGLQLSDLIFVLFAISGFGIIVRKENTKIRIKNTNKILSFIITTLLISTVLITPISNAYAVDFTQPLSENLGIADTLVITDRLGMTDSVAKSVSVAVSESLGMTDSVAKSVSVSRIDESLSESCHGQG
jgi:hypothetical protein